MVFGAFVGLFMILFIEYTGAEFRAGLPAGEEQPNIFGDEPMTKETFKRYARNLLLIWFCWNVFSAFLAGTNSSLFAVMGSKVTKLVRIDLFEAILYKQVSWFDREDRAPGIITSIMSGNVAELRGMTSETVVMVISVVFSLIFGILGGFFICWQQASISFIFSPVCMIGAYIGTRLNWKKQQGKEKGDVVKDDYDTSNALLSDCILNYKTVISFGQDNVDQINEKFT